MFSFSLGRTAGPSSAAATPTNAEPNTSNNGSKERAVYAMFHESLDALLLEAIKHTSLTALRDAGHATRAHNYAPLDLFHTFVLACDLFSRRATGRAMLLQSLSNISRLSSLNMIPLTNSVAQMTCDLVRRLALRQQMQQESHTIRTVVTPSHAAHKADSNVDMEESASERKAELGISAAPATTVLPLISDEELLLRLLQLIASLLSVWPLTSTALAELLGMLVLLFISATPNSLVEVTCRATLSQCTTKLAAVLHADQADADDAATFTSQLHAVAYVRDLCRMASGQSPRWLRVTTTQRDTTSNSVISHETMPSHTQSAPLVKTNVDSVVEGHGGTADSSTISVPTRSNSGQTTSNSLTSTTTTTNTTTTISNNDTIGGVAVTHQGTQSAVTGSTSSNSGAGQSISASPNLLCMVPIPYRLRVFLYDLLQTLWTELKANTTNGTSGAMASSVSPMVVQCLNEDILAAATQAKGDWCDEDAEQITAWPCETQQNMKGVAGTHSTSLRLRDVSSSSFASSSSTTTTTTATQRYGESGRTSQQQKHQHNSGEVERHANRQQLHQRRRRRVEMCRAAAEERHLYYLGQRLAITVVRLFAHEVRSAAASLFIHHTMLLKELSMHVDEARAGLHAGPHDTMQDNDDGEDRSALRGGMSSTLRAAMIIFDLWRHALQEDRTTLSALLTLQASNSDTSPHAAATATAAVLLPEGLPDIYNATSAVTQSRRGSRRAAAATRTQAVESRLSASALFASGDGSPFLLAPHINSTTALSVAASSTTGHLSTSRRALSHDSPAHIDPTVLPGGNIEVSDESDIEDDEGSPMAVHAPPVASSFLGVVYQAVQLLAQLLLARDVAPYGTVAEAMSLSESESASEAAEGPPSSTSNARVHTSTASSAQKQKQHENNEEDNTEEAARRHTFADEVTKKRSVQKGITSTTTTRRAAATVVPRGTQQVILEECVQGCAAFLSSVASGLVQLAEDTHTTPSSNTTHEVNALRLREVLYSLHAPWIACVQRVTQPSYFSLAHEASLCVVLGAVGNLVRTYALLGLSQLRDEYLQVLCAALYAVDGGTRELLAMCGTNGSGASSNIAFAQDEQTTFQVGIRSMQPQPPSSHHLLRRLGDNLSSNVQRLSQSVQDVFATESATRPAAAQATRYPLAREQQLSTRGVLAGFVWKVTLLECMADIGLGTSSDGKGEEDNVQREKVERDQAGEKVEQRRVKVTVELGDGWRYVADALALSHCLLHRIQLCAHWMHELLGDAACRPQLQALVQRLRSLVQTLPLRFTSYIQRNESSETLRGIDALVRSTLQLSTVALRTGSPASSKAQGNAQQDAPSEAEEEELLDNTKQSLLPPLFCCRLPAAELRYCCGARGVVRQWGLLGDILALCYMTLCVQAGVDTRHGQTSTSASWTAAAHVMQHLHRLTQYMTQPSRLQRCTAWLLRSGGISVAEEEAAFVLDGRDGAASVTAAMVEAELGTAALPLPAQVRVLESVLSGVMENVVVLAGFTRTLRHFYSESNPVTNSEGGGTNLVAQVVTTLTARPLAQTPLVRLASMALSQQSSTNTTQSQGTTVVNAQEGAVLDEPFALLATLYKTLQEMTPAEGNASDVEVMAVSAVVESVRSSTVRNVLKFVQGYGEETSGVAWQHLLRLLQAVVDCSNAEDGNNEEDDTMKSNVSSGVRDRVNTAFRILEAIQHNYITSLDDVGMTLLVRVVGGFVTHHVPGGETQDHRLHIHLSAVQLLWSIADHLASNAPTQRRSDNTNSNNENDEQSGLWCALLQELMRGCVDERQEIRQGALKTLLALVQTHGPRFTAASWRCLLREALVPLMILIQHGVARCAVLPTQRTDVDKTSVNTLAPLQEKKEKESVPYAALLRLDVEDGRSNDVDTSSDDVYARERGRKSAALLDIFAAHSGQLEEMRLTLMDAGSRILFTHYITLHTVLGTGSDAYLLEQVLNSFVQVCGAARVVIKGTSGEASALAAVQALHGLLVEVPGGLSVQLIMRVWLALLDLVLDREQHALAHTATKQCTQAVLSALLEALCDDFMMRYGHSMYGMADKLPHHTSQQPQQQSAKQTAVSSSSLWSLWQRRGGNEAAGNDGDSAATTSDSSSSSTSSETGAHAYREMCTNLRAFCFDAMVRVLCASAQSTAVVQSYYYPNKVQRTWLEGVRALWPILLLHEAHTLLHSVLFSQFSSQSDIETFLLHSHSAFEDKAVHERPTLRAALPPGAHPDFLQLLVQLMQDFLHIQPVHSNTNASVNQQQQQLQRVDTSHVTKERSAHDTLTMELITTGITRTSTLLCLQYAPIELLSPHSPTNTAMSGSTSTSFSVSDELFVQCMAFIEEAVQRVLSDQTSTTSPPLQKERDAVVLVFCEAVAGQLRMANKLLPGQPVTNDNNSNTEAKTSSKEESTSAAVTDESLARATPSPRIARLVRFIDMLEEVMQQLLTSISDTMTSSNSDDTVAMATMSVIEDHIVPVLVSGSMSTMAVQLQPVAQRSLDILERWAAVPNAAEKESDDAVQRGMNVLLTRLRRRITLSLQTRSLSIFEAYAATPHDLQAANALCDTLRSLLASCQTLTSDGKASTLSESQRNELKQLLPALTRLVGCVDVRVKRTAADVTAEQTVRGLLAQTLATLHTLLIPT